MQEQVLWTDNTDLETAEPDDAAYNDMLEELCHVPINRPVIVTGQANLWSGAKPVSAVINPSSVADIVARFPWSGMDFNEWLIDGYGDLRYQGIHNDGVNTVIFRELKSNRIPDLSQGEETLRRKSAGLGRRIRRMALR
jgi:hypothetical protein